ncbi:hypothetical protein WA026_010095 [Henosepilachna vigintioctopunctata]|uniref:Eclosion hormone n=1 Tax=Henosepilachna vigintioctopunctata TaxID=420089 RepID=A0AAW1UHA6_9CUCU
MPRHLLMSKLMYVVLPVIVVYFVSANYIGICIRNCAQCKKMFGPYFEGQLCADACLSFKGRIIPDCEDIFSVGPFLNEIHE